MAESGYASVNGLKMYYESYGSGKPLILLHGAFGVTGMFAPIVLALAETRHVIAVELQGHGHTADSDRPMSFELLADDIAALIKCLDLQTADLLGYSLGGGIALQTVIRHPDVIRKLVVVSAPCKSDGWYPETRAGLRAINADVAKTWVGSPMHQAYTSVAPNPDDWPALVGKVGQVVGKDYDWSRDIAVLKTPTMIVVGDADGIRPAHAVEFFELLGGGKADGGFDGPGMARARLAILPGHTHFTTVSSPALTAAVIPFLDAPMPDK
jgi:pimeloyl-ACP methyl ester carboxylesterase